MSPTEATPMQKRRRHADAATTPATTPTAQATPNLAVPSEPASVQQPVTVDGPIELEAPAADGSADPRLQAASDGQLAEPPQAGVPDNNTVSWAPLIVKVSGLPLAACKLCCCELQVRKLNGVWLAADLSVVAMKSRHWNVMLAFVVRVSELLLCCMQASMLDASQQRDTSGFDAQLAKTVLQCLAQRGLF